MRRPFTSLGRLRQNQICRNSAFFLRSPANRGMNMSASGNKKGPLGGLWIRAEMQGWLSGHPVLRRARYKNEKHGFPEIENAGERYSQP